MGDIDKFAAQISAQEWWSSFGFWVLVVGLIGDIIVLCLPAHRGRLEKSLSAVFTIVVIIGCAIEHVADGKISDLIPQVEAFAASANRDAATAKKGAADAIKKAGDLGVTVDNLNQFVNTNIAEVNTDEQRLRAAQTAALAAAQETQKDLTKITALLNQERDLHAKIEQLTKPLIIKDAYFSALVKTLKKLAGQTYEISPYPDAGDEWANFSERLIDALNTAGWVRTPANNEPMQPMPVKGVMIRADSNASTKAKNAAQTLVDALKSEGIDASLEKREYPDDPRFKTDDVLIQVGPIRY